MIYVLAECSSGSYQIPRMEEFTDRLVGARFITMLDLVLEYWPNHNGNLNW